MSAFVVSDETMHKCVRAILRPRQYQSPVFGVFAGVDTSERDAGTRIGRLLFTANVEAVEALYRKDSPPAPVTYVHKDDWSAYTLPRRIADYKALQCLAYQCAEDGVIDSAIYAELREAISTIARTIVEDMPEYEKATWG